jgi:hypothetical protein
MVGATVRNGAWRKSSFSGIGDCVEVASEAAGVAIRNSKDPSGTVVQCTAAEWRAFLDDVRGGELDG